jgi:hypothetical protein
LLDVCKRFVHARTTSGEIKYSQFCDSNFDDSSAGNPRVSVNRHRRKLTPRGEQLAEWRTIGDVTINGKQTWHDLSVTRPEIDCFQAVFAGTFLYAFDLFGQHHEVVTLATGLSHYPVNLVEPHRDVTV